MMSALEADELGRRALAQEVLSGPEGRLIAGLYLRSRLREHPDWADEEWGELLAREMWDEPSAVAVMAVTKYVARARAEGDQGD
jgi:hypothetical protein